MKPIDFADISIQGDLAVRSGRNFARLEGQWYRPEEVFKADSHGWPGDWEGRTMLALIMLEQATHRKSAYLEEIFDLFPGHLNERGYFGQILPDGVFDEQHFGGHSWSVRALAEYYRYKNDPRALGMLETMVKNFLLPVKGSLKKYPIEPVARFDRQEVWRLSKLQTKTKHHAETSDAGCVFIMLDGATAAYDVLKWPELRDVIDEMIDVFMQMDLQALNIQTHATLSATRGILRMHRLTGEKKYLDMALARYSLYRGEAWTEAFGNYNWFGAPRWTEPCAIVDSFIVAVTLWNITGDVSFLNDAHLIYYNALSHGNRENGSFGSDICCGAAEADNNLFLAPINFETYWCCTMRGGDGLSQAARFHFFTGEDTACIPFYNSCEARLTFGAWSAVIRESSHYPFDGCVHFTVIEADLTRPVTFKFFVPKWSREASIKINGDACGAVVDRGFITICRQFSAGDEIELSLGLHVYSEKAEFKNSVRGYHKFFYGPMLLGRKAALEVNSLEGNRFENYAEGQYKSSDIVPLPGDSRFERVGTYEFREPESGVVLSALCEVRDMTKEDSMRQMLFTDK